MTKTTRALFIGNSFTARNDLPGLLSRLVAAGGKGELEHELISINGASLRTHLNKGEAQKRISASHWDYVVLQEQSTLPIKNAKRTGENIRDFSAAIKEPGVQTVLYMTWARQNAPETQTVLSETYPIGARGRRTGRTRGPGLAIRPCRISQPGSPRQGPEPPQSGGVLPGRLHLLRDALYRPIQIHCRDRQRPGCRDHQNPPHCGVGDGAHLRKERPLRWLSWVPVSLDASPTGEADRHRRDASSVRPSQCRR